MLSVGAEPLPAVTSAQKKKERKKHRFVKELDLPVAFYV
jgi:hypothetical protein